MNEVRIAAGTDLSGFSDQELAILSEAIQILNSPEFGNLVDAFNNSSGPIAVNINGQIIQLEPSAPVSGMTLGDTFVIGSEAFVSENELMATVLHELFRLRSGQAASGATQDQVTSFRDDTVDFVEDALKVLDNG